MSDYILMVEDSPTDAIIMQKSFEKTGYSGHIQIVPDGKTAISFLEKSNINDFFNLPQLILLDLNLPCKSGYEVLCVIKKILNGALYQLLSSLAHQGRLTLP